MTEHVASERIPESVTNRGIRPLSTCESSRSASPTHSVRGPSRLDSQKRDDPRGERGRGRQSLTPPVSRLPSVTHLCRDHGRARHARHHEPRPPPQTDRSPTQRLAIALPTEPLTTPNSGVGFALGTSRVAIGFMTGGSRTVLLPGTRHDAPSPCPRHSGHPGRTSAKASGTRSSGAHTQDGGVPSSAKVPGTKSNGANTRDGTAPPPSQAPDMRPMPNPEHSGHRNRPSARMPGTNPGGRDYGEFAYQFQLRHPTRERTTLAQRGVTPSSAQHQT